MAVQLGQEVMCLSEKGYEGILKYKEVYKVVAVLSGGTSNSKHIQIEGIDIWFRPSRFKLIRNLDNA